MNTFDQLKNILIERFSIKPDAIVLEAHFQKDLGFDSLDAVDLLFAVNEHFGARIPEEMLSDINTVSNLVEIVDRQKKRSRS